MTDLNRFLLGAIAMGQFVVGLFFLRFYFRVGDRLFLMFCGAFWLLGLIRLGLNFYEDGREHHLLHWVRFAAFLLILLAIIDKNLAPAPAAQDPKPPE